LMLIFFYIFVNFTKGFLSLIFNFVFLAFIFIFWVINF
jgi:hypothetical protein